MLSSGNPASDARSLTRSRRSKALLLGMLAVGLAACESESREDDGAEDRVSDIAVTYAEATRERVEDIETSIASVAAKSAPDIAAEIDGTIEELRVDEGDSVEEDEVLAVLDKSEYDIEFRRADAEQRRIRVLIEQQERGVEREEQLNEDGHSSALALENVQSELAVLREELAAARSDYESAERDLAKTTVEAPYDGRIAARTVSTGDYVSAGATLFEMTTDQLVQIRIPMPEVRASRLTEGLTVRLFSADAPETVITAEVEQVSPEVDAESRSISAITEVEDAPANWLSGASINAEVVLEERESIVIAPASIARRPSGTVAYVLDGDIAREREIEIGKRTSDWVEVLNGIEAGERVVVDGAGFLSDRTPVDAREHEGRPIMTVSEAAAGAESATDEDASEPSEN